MKQLTASQPILIAHRGYSGKYPENTLLSYQAAYQCGARYMELDLQLSKDAVPILHHDKSLLRMSGVDESVFNMTAKEIKKLIASYPEKFATQYTHNTFTTFKRYCKWLRKHPDVITFVEVKQESIDQFGLELVMSKVLKQINKKQVNKQSVIISFNDEVVEYVQSKSELAAGWVLPKWSEKNKNKAYVLNPRFLFSSHRILPKNNEDIWQGQWEWAIYNFDDVDSAIAMANRGINYLETNEIGSLMQDNQLSSGNGIP